MKKFFGRNAPAAFVVLLLIVLFALSTQWAPSPPQMGPSSPQFSPGVNIFPTFHDVVPNPIVAPALLDYIEVTEGCGPHYEGTCVNMRSGPGTEFPVVSQLRNGMVLKVASSTVGDDGRVWYKIGFDGGIRYPERITSDWYVASDYVQLFKDIGERVILDNIKPTNEKHIVINRTKQMLYAYDGDTLFMQQAISTGLEFTPTPRGMFWVYKKMPDSYMQGPLPGISDQYYDLPGVPWDLYFTYQGGAIHGAYWHNNFGMPWSHGCVNLPPEQAKLLYDWADLGTPVLVRD